MKPRWIVYLFRKGGNRSCYAVMATNREQAIVMAVQALLQRVGTTAVADIIDCVSFRACPPGAGNPKTVEVFNDDGCTTPEDA